MKKKWYDNEAYLALAFMVVLYVVVFSFSVVAQNARADLPRYMDENSQAQTLRDMQDFWARDRLTASEIRALRLDQHRKYIDDQHRRAMELNQFKIREEARRTQERKRDE